MMELLKIFSLLFMSIGYSSGNFKAITLTEPGAIKNLYSVKYIKCEIVSVLKNNSYNIEEIVHNDDVYTVNPYKSYKLNIIDNNVPKFTIFKNSTSLNPAKFTLFDINNNLNLTFGLYNESVTLKYENSTSNWEDSREMHRLLPSYRYNEFMIEINNYYLNFVHRERGAIYSIPIYNNTFNKLIVHNHNVTNATWIFYVQEIRKIKLTVDQFETNCWNSTNNHQNETEHDKNHLESGLIGMIYSQFKINETMENDLYNFKYSSDEEYTREYLNELHDDIKSNYMIGKETHIRIIRSLPLNKNESNIKSEYLQRNIFKNIRETYFKIIKSIELILSRFN